MSNWKDISLFKFQQIETINSKDIDEMDKLLFTVCQVFNYTEYELDNTNPLKVAGLIKKVTKLFSSEMKPQVVKKIGKYFIEYDPSKLTFGQYIELAFFFQMPILTGAHYILASLSNKRWCKNKTDEHRAKADYFLTAPIDKVIGSVKQFATNYEAFNKYETNGN